MVKTDEILLELKCVTKHFRIHEFLKKPEYVHAMDDVSFKIRRGEILSIVGESGSGKTTTAKLVAKIHRADSGEIKFKGKSIYDEGTAKDRLSYKKRVQMIFQDPFASLNPTHTIKAIMSRPFIIHGLTEKKNIYSGIHEILKKVGMDPPEQFMNKFPHELSGGQRQRINIARVISINPALVLADEPTSMLDVSIRMIIMNMMKKFRDEQGISYLYITHDLAGARYISDRIAVMYAGMVMEIGKSDEVIQKAHHPYTQLLRSAAPQPEKQFRNTRLTTRGDLPSLINPPPGCRFNPRCPKAEPECSGKIPELTEVKPDHLVRCILAKEDQK
jgi:peptide/nickel transport system ATP-binding protein